MDLHQTTDLCDHVNAVSVSSGSFIVQPPGHLGDHCVSVSTIGSGVIQRLGRQRRLSSISVSRRIGSSFNSSVVILMRYSFSIHNRIVHRSTRVQKPCLRCVSVSTIGSFIVQQIVREHRESLVEVSVSTIGSFIVQPHDTTTYSRLYGVSVSTIGSFIVQLRPRRRCAVDRAVSVSTIGSFIVQLARFG